MSRTVSKVVWCLFLDFGRSGVYQRLSVLTALSLNPSSAQRLVVPVPVFSLNYFAALKLFIRIFYVGNAII